jgi:hypothetical protein
MATHEETLTDLISRQRAAKSQLARTLVEGGRTSDDDDDREPIGPLSEDEKALIRALRGVERERR